MKITRTEQLREFYGLPKGRTLQKELKTLDAHCKNFLAHAPFMVLSTSNARGQQDASPRGGEAGFARVLNDRQIIIADAKGNNRLDSISNMVENPQVGALFFIPGIKETLRLNGQAEIRTDVAFIDLFAEEQNKPHSCIVITIETVFLHCAKALMRSDLWGEKFKVRQADFPTMGEMLKAHLNSDEPAESHEAMVNRYKGDL